MTMTMTMYPWGWMDNKTTNQNIHLPKLEFETSSIAFGGAEYGRATKANGLGECADWN